MFEHPFMGAAPWVSFSSLCVAERQRCSCSISLVRLNPAHNNPVDIVQTVIAHILKQNMRFALGAACLPGRSEWGKMEYRDTVWQTW